MIVGVTGHRPDKLGSWDPGHPVVDRVKRALRNALASPWPSLLITGMALGVDQWAAQEAIDLGIPFVAALPCDDFEKTWPLLAQERFQTLVRKAKHAIVVRPGPYHEWKLQRRNEFIVDMCASLIAVWDGSSGGTANCVEYADSVNRPVRRLEF